MSDRTDYFLRIEIREPWPQHLQSNSVLHDAMSMMHELKASYPHISIQQSGHLVSELNEHQAWIQEQLEFAGCSQELIAEVFDHAEKMFGVKPFEHGPDA